MCQVINLTVSWVEKNLLLCKKIFSQSSFLFQLLIFYWNCLLAAASFKRLKQLENFGWAKLEGGEEERKKNGVKREMNEWIERKQIWNTVK